MPSLQSVDAIFRETRDLLTPLRLSGKAACLAAALTALTGNTHAQDALMSALSTAPTRTVPVQPVQTGPYLGPVNLLLGFYSGAEYQDNINFASKDGLSDTILRTGVNTRFNWAITPQSRLSLNAGVGYARYLSHPEYSRVELAPNSGLAWDVGFDDGTVTFFDQFSYSRQVFTVGAISGVGEFPRYENVAGVRATWQPGQWLLEGGYSHDEFFSDTRSFDYLNRSSEYIFARQGWRFAPATQAGIEQSAGFTRYYEALMRNSYSLSAGPFVEWQLTRTLGLKLRGGGTEYHFESTPNGQPAMNLSSYYVNGEVTHQLTDFISQNLSVVRNVQLGYNQGSDFLQELVANYNVSWAFTQWMSVTVSTTYEHGSQGWQGLTGPLDEIYDRYGFGPSFNWRLTDKISGRLAYFRWSRQSNLENRNYLANTVSLQIDYTF